jgi:hypothetical protein
VAPEPAEVSGLQATAAAAAAEKASALESQALVERPVEQPRQMLTKCLAQHVSSAVFPPFASSLYVPLHGLNHRGPPANGHVTVTE